MLSPIFQHFSLKDSHSFSSQQYFLPFYDTSSEKHVFVFAFSPLNQNLKQSSQYQEKKNWFEVEFNDLSALSDSLNPENCYYLTHPSDICIQIFSNKLEKYHLYCQKLFLVVKAEPMSKEQSQSITQLQQQITQFIQNKDYLLPITHFLPKTLSSLQYSASIACGVKYIYLNDGKIYKFCYEGSGWVNIDFRKQLIQKYVGYMQIKQWEQFINCEYMEGAVHENNIRSFKSIQQVGTMPWKNLHSCDLACHLKKSQLNSVFQTTPFQAVKKLNHFYHFEAVMMEAYEKGNCLSAELNCLFYYHKFFACFTNLQETFGMNILFSNNQYIINNIFYTHVFDAKEKIYQFESLLQTILNEYIFTHHDQITLLITTNETSPIYWHWRQKLYTLESEDASYCCSASKWIKVITPLRECEKSIDLPIKLSDKLWNDFREIHNGPMNKLSKKVSKL